MVRTTITVFSLDSEAGPYLCVSKYMHAQCSYAPFLCVSCVFDLADSICSSYKTHHTETLFIWIWCCEFTHCCGFWLSCACQNELTSQTTGPLNVMVIFIQMQGTLCVSVCPLWEWGLECYQCESKLGQAQMDRLLDRRADMSQAVIALHKGPQC